MRRAYGVPLDGSRASYTDRVEAFFVVVTACVLLGVGAWALTAARRILALTDADSPRRRAGDD